MSSSEVSALYFDETRDAFLDLYSLFGIGDTPEEKNSIGNDMKYVGTDVIYHNFLFRPVKIGFRGAHVGFSIMKSEFANKTGTFKRTEFFVRNGEDDMVIPLMVALPYMPKEMAELFSLHIGLFA